MANRGHGFYQSHRLTALSTYVWIIGSSVYTNYSTVKQIYEWASRVAAINHRISLDELIDKSSPFCTNAFQAFLNWRQERLWKVIKSVTGLRAATALEIKDKLSDI